MRTLARSLRLGAALVAATLTAAGTISGQPLSPDADYIAPLAPTDPTEPGQCRELDAAWRIIRNEMSTKHSACLQSRGSEGEGVSRTSPCTYVSCEKYHFWSHLGTDEVRKCDTAVRAYLDRKRKEDADAKAREAEAARAAADAERKQREAAAQGGAASGGGSGAQQGGDAERTRRETETAARERQAALDDSDRRLRQAQAERERDWIFAIQRQEQRERTLGSLSTRERSNTSTIAAIIDGSAEAANSAGRTIRDIVTSMGSSSGTATSASDFDLGSAGTKRYERVMDNMLSLAGFTVPFAGIPLSIARNSALQSLELTDQLTRTIADFEHADPRDLEAALQSFPQKALGLRPLVSAVADAAVGGYVQELANTHMITPAVDEIAIRARLAVDDGSAAALFRSSPDPRMHVEFWSEPRAASLPVVMRDERGTVLLFNRQGQLAHYDAAAQHARYSPAQVEQLVARSDLTPRYVAPLTWTRRNTVFVWDTDPLLADPYREVISDWVAGQFSGALMAPANKARDRIWDATERKP